MRSNPSDATDIRLAELMAALSIATDLGMGQPLEFALSSCVLAVRLGEALRLDESDLRDIYYEALLRYIGCNAETRLLASIAGDELAFRGEYATVDPGRSTQVLGLLLRYVRQANAGSSPLHLAQMVARGFLALPEWLMEGFGGHCEVAQRLAVRLGFDDGIVRALGQLYERWDGKGTPAGLKGENIAIAVRVVTLAQDAITFHRLGGLDAAVAVARERSGSAYDPRIAECFGQQASTLLSGIDDQATWDVVLTVEAGEKRVLADAEFDTACEAIADFADIKSPFLLGHSRGVAALASDAARRGGLPKSYIVTIRRASLLHDVGRVGVSAGIWGKPGSLTDQEWEKVRLIDSN